MDKEVVVHLHNGILPRHIKLGGASGKEPAWQCRRLKEIWVQSLGWEDVKEGPEGGHDNHSNNLSWRNPWTEEPRGLQSIGLQRIIHDWSVLGWTNA